MLHHLLWFLVGGWVGSFVTLVMVAILRKNKEAPKAFDEKTAQQNDPVTIRKTYDPV